MMSKKAAAALLMAAGLVLVACSEEKSENIPAVQSEKVYEDEITVFDINSGDWQFDDRIAKEIMARTGVKITVIDPTDDPSEKVDLMLAYRDYPDMILISLSDIGRYQDAGVLLNLQPYLAQAPNVVEMYGDMLMRLSTEDGKIFYLSNWYGRDEDAVSAFHIRYDYMVEVAGKERADSDEPFTQEEFLELLRAFKEKYPQIDGQETIAFTTSLNLNYTAPLQGMYGLKTYYEHDGKMEYLVRDPKYLEMILFLNQMYREGLMDKEWVVNRRALFHEKLLDGRVFATACAYWDLDEENGVLRQEGGKETCYYGYKVLGNGVEETQTTYSGRNSMGWDAIAITDNCKNPEAVVRVMNFLASEEGQYLMMWGIEGEDWDYVDGVRTPREEIVESLKAVVNDTIDRTSIRKWTWFIKNGLGSDGSPYDMMAKYQPSDEAVEINRRMKYDYWDTSLYFGLEPESGTHEALMWRNIEEIYEKAYPRMVNASSQEEAVRLYEKMIQDMEAEGLKAVEAVITQNYQKRMELWGE